MPALVGLEEPITTADQLMDFHACLAGQLGSPRPVAGRLSLARFVDLTSAGPARLYNMACKGRIAAGYDADFTVVDLKRSETITNNWVASKAGWTPYDGVRVQGWPVGTFIRGRRVMWQGELVTASQGEPVRFLETLKA